MFKKTLTLLLVLLTIFTSCNKNFDLKTEETESKQKLFDLLKVKESDIGKANSVKSELSFKTYAEAYRYFSELYKTPLIQNKKGTILAYPKSSSLLAATVSGANGIHKKSTYGSEFVDYANVFIDNTSSVAGGTLATLVTTYYSSPRVNFAYTEAEQWPYERTYTAYQIMDFRITDINFAFAGAGSISKSSENITTTGFTTYLTQSYTVIIAGLLVPVSSIIKVTASLSSTIPVPATSIPTPIQIAHTTYAEYVR